MRLEGGFDAVQHHQNSTQLNVEATLHCEGDVGTLHVGQYSTLLRSEYDNSMWTMQCPTL